MRSRRFPVVKVGKRQVVSILNFVTWQINENTRCKGDSLIGRLISDLVLQLLSFIAENERNNIRQRQAEGIRAAKKRGVKFGRPLTACPSDFPMIVQAYRKKEISCSEAMELSRMKPSTFFYYLKKHLNNFDGQTSV